MAASPSQSLPRYIPTLDAAIAGWWRRGSWLRRQNRPATPFLAQSIIGGGVISGGLNEALRDAVGGWVEVETALRSATIPDTLGGIKLPRHLGGVALPERPTPTDAANAIVSHRSAWGKAPSGDRLDWSQVRRVR